MSKVFLATLPKSGTHFLTRFFFHMGFKRLFLEDLGYRVLIQQALTGELNGDESIRLQESRNSVIRSAATLAENSYICHHYSYDAVLVSHLTDAGLAPIFLMRDPRDYVVSLTNHILKHGDHKHHQRFATMGSSDERYIAVIEGLPAEGDFPAVSPLTYTYGLMQGWLKDPEVLGVKFEQVIGPKGGGTLEQQQTTFGKILEHINSPLRIGEIADYIDQSYDPQASMFNKGTLGQWQHEFSSQVAGIC
jgi:hypothetical protein